MGFSTAPRAAVGALLVSAAVAASAGFATTAGQAAARVRAATICNDSYDAEYAAAAVHLTVTRTGHYVSDDKSVTVDSQQVDTIAPIKDARDRVKLEVQTVCGHGE